MKRAGIILLAAALALAGLAGYAAEVKRPPQGVKPEAPRVRTQPAQGSGAALPGRASWTPQATHETIHFTILMDFADAEYAGKLQWDLEKYFSELQKEFWDYIPPAHRESHITMAVFDKQAAFDAYAAQDAGTPPGEKGYSSRDTGRVGFLRQDAYRKDTMIFVHEMAHVFNRFCCPATPLWLDEGLAQYYAYYAAEEAGDPDIADGVSSYALSVLDGALRNETFLRMGDVMDLTDDAFYSKTSKVNYAESWALVYYLRRGLANDGDKRFGEYYGIIARGEGQVEAFTTVYGSNLSFMNDMWLSYLKWLYDRNVRTAPAGAKADAGKTSPARGAGAKNAQRR